MAKTTKPEKPVGKETISTEEHNYTMIMDRILTWHSISVNRSIQARDPVNLLDASQSLGDMLKDKRVQDFLKSIYIKTPEPEKAEDESPEEDGQQG